MVDKASHNSHTDKIWKCGLDDDIFNFRWDIKDDSINNYFTMWQACILAYLILKYYL